MRMFPRLDKNMSQVEQKILSYLEPRDLAACKLVCMKWYVVIQKREGKAPLFEAALRGHNNVAAYLLRNKYLTVNEKDPFGIDFTPLMMAAQSGDESIVQLLLERRDTNVNAYSDIGYTALMIATMHGHVKTVELLLARAGTDVNATFLSIPSGETALDYAGHHVQLCSQTLANMAIQQL